VHTFLQFRHWNELGILRHSAVAVQRSLLDVLSIVSSLLHSRLQLGIRDPAAVAYTVITITVTVTLVHCAFTVELCYMTTHSCSKRRNITPFRPLLQLPLLKNMDNAGCPRPILHK
jgi:hypothetical protein